MAYATTKFVTSVARVSPLVVAVFLAAALSFLATARIAHVATKVSLATAKVSHAMTRVLG